jgi:NAD-dependent deacetylase
MEDWEMIKSRFVGEDVKPNIAHNVIALMQKEGIVKSVITQNVDNLHQMAGSQNVIELHGNAHSLVCMECGDERPLSEEEILGDIRVCSSCSGTLKPNFTFFGEELPINAITNGCEEAMNCDLMIIVGTSGEVYPAASLPRNAKNNGAKIIEINPDISNYSLMVTDEYIGDKAGDAFEQIAKSLGLL